MTEIYQSCFKFMSDVVYIKEQELMVFTQTCTKYKNPYNK